MSKLTSKPCSLLCNNFIQIEVFKLICVIHERERERQSYMKLQPIEVYNAHYHHMKKKTSQPKFKN